MNILSRNRFNFLRAAIVLGAALIFSCVQPGGLGEQTPEQNPERTPEAPVEPPAVTYTAGANGVNGGTNSTAINFIFAEAVTGLQKEDITLGYGTGRLSTGALTGGGREWTLGIAVETAGNITVKISKKGIETGEKTVTVYKQGEAVILSWSAAANGAKDTETSTAIVFTLSGAVAGLTAADIVLENGTGSVIPGVLTGEGQIWTLGIIVDHPGTLWVQINKAGIEDTEQSLTVYQQTETSGDESESASESENESEKENESESEPPPPPWTEGPVEGWEEEEEEEPPVVTGIAVLSPPDTTIYAKGQAFDPSGLVVAWVYSNQATVTMAASAYTLDQPDMTRPTPKQIKVHAGGFETSFNIQVLNSDKALQSITVTGPTNKVQDWGLPFNKTGMIVTGNFSNNTTENLTSLAAIMGYDPYKRGPQEVSVKVNGKTAAITDIVTRIGTAADASVASYKTSYIKGEPMTMENANIRVMVIPGTGSYFYLTYNNGNITPADIAPAVSSYNPNQTGKQTLSFTLDGKSLTFSVYVIDVEPAVWFDYGYMRHAGDPGGAGKSAGITAAKYSVKPNETLVLAPVRYLVGYNSDHSDAGASYTWTVSGGSHSTSKGGELLHFTPSAAGTYTVTVNVTGRSYLTGQNITRTASTEVVCFDTTPTPVNIKLTLKNFSPGQFTERGNGLGWSLGAFGGYFIWSVEHRASYKISGNAFSGWWEPGTVWVQEDRNGNGKPDETWYELKGADDSNPAQKDYITRRYALTYIDVGEGSAIGEYKQPPQTRREIHWADSKGRTGYLRGGFPYDWGVEGSTATYTGTLLRDKGNIDTGSYDHADATMTGYVDAVGDTFYIADAMDLAGSPVTLGAVRFLKVQTAVFKYGGIFGEVSTEIASADFLGATTTFPMPD